MENIVLPSYRMEYIPAHKYLGVYNRCTTSKGDIWPNHDCDLLCGYISSMPSEKTHPIVTGMTAGWAAENGDVMSRVEEMAWSFDPHTIEYEWNEDVCQIYQRHYPEGLGYQVLRPVRKLENK